MFGDNLVLHHQPHLLDPADGRDRMMRVRGGHRLGWQLCARIGSRR
jgi:hypothetical protein